MPKIPSVATKTDIFDLRKDNKLLNKRFDNLNYDFSHLNKRFDDLEDKLTVWKSEIHNLIDSGFTSKAKQLNEKVGILNGRTSDLRIRTEKLEFAVFGKSI